MCAPLLCLASLTLQQRHTLALFFPALILLRYFFFSLSHLKSAVSFTQTHTQSHIYTRTKLTPSIWYAFNATDVRSPTSIYNGVHQQPSQPFKWREGRGLSVMLHRSQVTLFRWRDTLAVVLLHQQSAGLQGWACVCARARVWQPCLRHLAAGGLWSERASLTAATLQPVLFSYKQAQVWIVPLLASFWFHTYYNPVDLCKLKT